jgi:hypothetical protein
MCSSGCRRKRCKLKRFPSIIMLLLLSDCGASRMLGQSSGAHGGAPATHAATFQGLVRDLACPMMNPKSTSTDFDLGCASACARAGSPLIVLSKAGLIFFPISGDMPDVSQREKLIPFVGKQVRVTGTVYERAGTRAIVISSIHEVTGLKTKSKTE